METIICKQCFGEGVINDTSPQMRSPPALYRPITCPSCGGRGTIEKKKYRDRCNTILEKFLDRFNKRMYPKNVDFVPPNVTWST